MMDGQLASYYLLGFPIWLRISVTLLMNAGYFKISRPRSVPILLIQPLFKSIAVNSGVLDHSAPNLATPLP
jgi:hypothetical protein